MERITRLELATSTLARWRSTRWATAAYQRNRSNSCSSERWCLRSESNQWHGDFQSPALPTELQRRTGRWLLYLKFRFCKGVNSIFFKKIKTFLILVALSHKIRTTFLNRKESKRMCKEHLTRLTTYGLIIEKEHRRFCSLLLRILIYKQKEQRRFDLKQDGSVF